MALIFFIGIAAIAVLGTYNTAMMVNPRGTAATVTGIRQSTSTLLAFTNGVRSVLDGLQMISRPSAIGPSAIRIGTTDRERDRA